MFQISETPLEHLPLRQEMAHAAAGGYVSFEGWVRNHNEGRTVSALEYEAYEPLALSEGQKIIEEAKAKFDILDAACLHRVGKLVIGEMAVWVGVASAHRGAAFDACEYIIDEIKHRLPIWKKETYTDGDSGWVNCQHCAHHAPKIISPEEYYDRQLRLPEIGPDGQERLKKSRVLVIGAGGLGCSALQYLAAAGVGTLGICEFDTVEASNLHRQVLYTTEDIGQPKVDAAAARLRQLNPLIHVQTHPQAFGSENARSLLMQYDLILDATDQMETKLLISDVASGMWKPLVHASLYQYEGQILTVLPGGPCLRCLWPTVMEEAAGCMDGGILGSVAGALGALQALEALKQLLDLPGKLGKDDMLTLDLLSHQTHRLKRARNKECPICRLQVSDEEEEPDNPQPVKIRMERIPQSELSEWIILDTSEERSPHCPANPVPPLWHVPYSEYVMNPPTLDPNKKYLLVCPYGGRSLFLAKALRRQGVPHVYSLAGGTPALEAFWLGTAVPL